MVYCGKPSRGCQMCRTRRIKCDEAKPTCLQCKKSRRQCPGYKDDFDLVFRNETQATERRARKSVNSKNVKIQRSYVRSGSGDSGYGSSSSSQEALIPASSSFVQRPPSISIDQQAFHYFLANFVLVPYTEKSRGHLAYLIPLIQNEPSDTQLHSALSAVALASLANRPNSKSLLGQAGQLYMKALQIVNKALTNPATQKSDQTLASVLLLGLFETITLRRGGIGSWGAHIEGAVMLVKMRGKKQLRTKVGKALFLAVRVQMLINCMSASKSPDLGVEWWTKDASNDVSYVVIKLNLLVAELRADVNRAMASMPRSPENYEKVLDLVRRAQELEQGFVDWEASVPNEWSYKTVAWADAIPDSELSTSEVYPGKVDMYPDLFIASQWNIARVARLLLSGIIIRCTAWLCAPVDYRTTPEYASMSRLGIDMINDIVASIPFHLGWHGDRGDTRMGDCSGFLCGKDDNGTAKSLGAFYIVWPVFTAMCSDFTTDAQRKYIIGRMKYMADMMGVSGAAALIHFQLRLPSMVIKRDLMCLAPASSKQPSATRPSAATPVSTSSFNFPKTPSISIPQAPLIASPSIVGTSPSATVSEDPSASVSEAAVKEEEKGEGEEEEEEEPVILTTEEKEKKKAEKEAFHKTYVPTIKETSGDDITYLHGPALRPSKGAGT